MKGVCVECGGFGVVKKIDGEMLCLRCMEDREIPKCDNCEGFLTDEDDDETTCNICMKDPEWIARHRRSMELERKIDESRGK